MDPNAFNLSFGSGPGNTPASSGRPMRAAKQDAIQNMSFLTGTASAHHAYASPAASSFAGVSYQPMQADSTILGGAGMYHYNAQISGIQALNISQDENVHEDESVMSELSDLDSTFSPSMGSAAHRNKRVPESVASEATLSKRGRGQGGRGGRGGRSGRGGGGGRGAGAATSANAEDDVSLFAIVKGGKVSLKQTVDDWVDEYTQMHNKEPALLALMQFFIQSSGCRGIITPEMQAEMDIPEIIRKMTEQFDEESGEYPLILTGAKDKRFRASFVDFIMHLVRACQLNVIYDQYLMDNVISLLTGLTDSQVRAFRHTATLAAMKLMSALVEVALNLNQKLLNNQRQLDTERGRHQARQANDRLELLIRSKQDLEENQDEIRNMLAYIFKSVFVHRYRDILPDIRCICINELGVWMKDYPQMFLDDSYLKYIGWTLYDKVGEVRMKCLDALLPLYEDEGLYLRLELFTNKFKDRLTSMVFDCEPDVAVKAIKLFSCLYRIYKDLLTDKDCEGIYELVYSSHRGIALAAGEFLTQRVFTIPPEVKAQTVAALARRGRRESVNTLLLRDLVQFFIESELHEHGAYLVDALIDQNEMIKDWESMTELLLEEQDDPLDNDQEGVLIEIMVSAVKQAATGEPPIGRGQIKKFVQNKEQKSLIDERKRITDHFITKLPILLQRFVVDEEKIVNLLQIPQHFEVECYVVNRQEKNLEALLRIVCEIVEKHTREDILLDCSRIYESLTDANVVGHARAELEKSKLIDSVVYKFKSQMKILQQDELDKEDMFTIEVALRKLEAFYQCHDLSHWNLWDLLFEIIQPEDENRFMDPSLVAHALKCAWLSCFWQLKALEASKGSPDQDAIDKLQKRLTDFSVACKDKFLTVDDPRVCETAFLSLADLLIVFSWQLEEHAPALAALVQKADPTLEAQMSRFVDDHVFIVTEEQEVSDQTQVQALHGRRSMLASFCKLIVYNVVSLNAASAVFRHYSKFFNDFGDIIKTTLAKCREINKIEVACALSLALCDQWTALQEEFETASGSRQPIDHHSEGYVNLKELARKFALSFGPDPMKNRDSVLMLHREGIDFACAYPEGGTRLQRQGVPPNIAYFDILHEFVCKLYKPDKKGLLAYLNEKLPQAYNPNRDEWASAKAYHNELLEGNAMQTSAAASTTAPRRRGRQPQTPHAPGDVTGEFAPGATSTIAKRPRFEEAMEEEEPEENTITNFEA